ncbi:MAG: hypothetical protein J6R27_04625 [Muribaculaceae bacterium]|nr:hypothetical protein [Muribaculaceae bacterium]
MKRVLLISAMLTAVAAYGQAGYTGSSQNSHWLEYVHDDTYVANLLLPGAHHGYAGESWATLGETLASTQNRTVDELWNLGVRVFDIRPGVYNNQLYNYHTFRSSLSVEGFFNKITNKLNSAAGSQEFAIIHVLKGTNDDISSLWAKQMQNLANAGMLVEFRRDLTVGDMRGKILVICRENYGGPVQYNTYVRGWNETDLKNYKLYSPGNYRSANLYMQDLANVETGNSRLGEKKNLLKTLFDFTKSRLHDRGSQVNWIFNFASAYNGIAMSSNYKSVATELNQYVYDQLASVSKSTKRKITSSGTRPYPSGMVMMDYIGDSSVNGDKAIQAIISSNFDNLNVTDTDNIEIDKATNAEVVGYYNISGQRIENPQVGEFVIAKYSDGSAKKVIF